MFERILKLLHSMFTEEQPNTYYVDIPSPRDIVPNENVSYNKQKQTVTIKGLASPVWLTTVADTNSMDAMIDYGHTCILTGDFMEDDLAPGDICVYNNAGKGIIHRINRIDYDEAGRYFIFKGDNNEFTDPLKVRHIQWLLLGVIY